MNRSASRLFALALVCAPTLLLAQEEDPGRALARRAAEASGLAAWAQVGRVSFTWRHLGKKLSRHYEWDVERGEVVVELSGRRITVPQGGFTTPPEDPAYLEAWRAFINDSYWLLFPLHLAWDAGITCQDRGLTEVPGGLVAGRWRALEVRYGPEGGITPGDAYVLYLDERGLPGAWAFHKGGAAEPTLVTTREDYRELEGIRLPTRFGAGGGQDLIRIEDLEVLPR